MRFLGYGVLASLALLSVGCGRGLTVDLTATPDPAAPGDSVKWNLSVRNDSPCTTEEELVDLPDPLPDNIGAIAFIFGFFPELDEFGAREFCRQFTTGLGACSDQSCVAAHLREALGPEAASALSARAQSASSGPPASLPAVGACDPIDIGNSGIIGFCAFESLAPGETGTAMLTTTAPDNGSTRAAQMAIAFAPALGEDCRPGTEVGDGEWILSGCFPLEETASAPALSSALTGFGAAMLLMIGALGIYRRRNS